MQQSQSFMMNFLESYFLIRSEKKVNRKIFAIRCLFIVVAIVACNSLITAIILSYCIDFSCNLVYLRISSVVWISFAVVCFFTNN